MSDLERYRRLAETALKAAMTEKDANERGRLLAIAARWRMMALDAEKPGQGYLDSGGLDDEADTDPA